MARRVRIAWWETRSQREKRMLLALAAVLAFVLVWLLVIRPILDARAAAEAQLNAAVTDLARARSDALRLSQSRTGPGGAPVPLPLDGFLMTAAAEAGLTNAVVVGDGATRATLTLPSVRAQAFFAWIGQMEMRGLVVESMSTRPNRDQTITVEAVLRARNG